MKQICMNPIGYAKRDNTNVKDRKAISKIVLDDKLTPALTGIDEFSHLFVLFWMHEIKEQQKNRLLTHPRGRKNIPKVGVYATRTSNRRNPIGLTVVELIQVNENVLSVKGLDAMDSTPILDIKPYDSWDSVEAKIPEWWKLL